MQIYLGIFSYLQGKAGPSTSVYPGLAEGLPMTTEKTDNQITNNQITNTLIS
jgi:hypothetical protein